MSLSWKNPTKDTINIAGDDYLAQLVKEKMRKINSSHIEYVVFFKGKDADAITNAFKEYTSDMVKKAARPSVLAELKKLAELAKNTIIQKVKHKDKEQSL